MAIYNIDNIDNTTKTAPKPKAKVYSYKDLIHDITKDGMGIKNIGYGSTKGYLTKDGKFIRKDRETGKNKVYDFGQKFADRFGELRGFDKDGKAAISFNSQGLIPLEYKDKDGKSAVTFMAGPKGSKINMHGLGAGQTTGWYKVDETAKKDLYDKFNFKGQGHHGITTYVDRDSELETNHSIPEYSSLIDSNVKIDTKDPGSYFNELNLEDSDLNIKGTSAINELTGKNIHMPQPSNIEINHVKAINTSFGKDVAIENSKLDHTRVDQSDVADSIVSGGIVKDGSTIDNSRIKQNGKSVISKSALNDVTLLNENFNEKDFNPAKAKEQEATIISDSNMNHAVVQSNREFPTVMKNSRVKNVLAVLGLTAEDSDFVSNNGVNPLVLDTVIADDNHVNVKGMIPKVTGILMPGDKIDDKLAVNKNLPILNPKSNGMKEITKYEQNPDYDPDFNGDKFSRNDYGQSLLHNVEHAFRDENLLSKEAKNNILEWNHPEMAKQADPTDDL